METDCHGTHTVGITLSFKVTQAELRQLSELSEASGGNQSQIARALFRIGIKEVSKRKNLLQDLIKVGRLVTHKNRFV